MLFRLILPYTTTLSFDNCQFNRFGKKIFISFLWWEGAPTTLVSSQRAPTSTLLISLHLKTWEDICWTSLKMNHDMSTCSGERRILYSKKMTLNYKVLTVSCVINCITWIGIEIRTMIFYSGITGQDLNHVLIHIHMRKNWLLSFASFALLQLCS